MYYLLAQMIPPFGYGNVSECTHYRASPNLLETLVPSGNVMQVFAGHTGAVQCGEFTPDGKDSST